MASAKEQLEPDKLLSAIHNRLAAHEDFRGIQGLPRVESWYG
jgi:hypothetical protein